MWTAAGASPAAKCVWVANAQLIKGVKSIAVTYVCARFFSFANGDLVKLLLLFLFLLFLYHTSLDLCISFHTVTR